MYDDLDEFLKQDYDKKEATELMELIVEYYKFHSDVSRLFMKVDLIKFYLVLFPFSQLLKVWIFGMISVEELSIKKLLECLLEIIMHKCKIANKKALNKMI